METATPTSSSYSTKKMLNVMKAIGTSAYRFGSLARHAGWSAEACPFKPLTEAWFDWVDGWKDADEYLLSSQK